MKHVTNQINAGRRNFITALPKAVFAVAVLKELPFASKAVAALDGKAQMWADVRKYTPQALTFIDKHVSMRNNSKGGAFSGVAFMAYALDTRTRISATDPAAIEVERQNKAHNVLLCISDGGNKYISNSLNPGKGYEENIVLASPTVAKDASGKTFLTDMQKIANVYFITKDNVNWEARGEARYAMLYGMIKAGGQQEWDFSFHFTGTCVVAIQQPPKAASAEPGGRMEPPAYEEETPAR